MARPTARSFLLTVHEPDSTVLEDLRTGEQIHVAELDDVGSQILAWLATADAEEQ